MPDNKNSEFEKEGLMSSDAMKENSDVESKEFVITEEDVKAALQKDEVPLPPLNVEISDNPEEIRENVQETLKEAENLISEEMKEVSMEPIVPEVEAEDEDSVTKNIKRQNVILKIICGCLVVCTAINIFLAIPKVNKSNVYVSDSEINKVVMNEVKQGEIMSAAQVYNKNIDSMVAIHVESVTPSIFGDYVSAGSGSGFIISEDGYVLTNYHVIEGATTINVVMANGKEYQAKLIGSEADNDIAVLKLETEDKFVPVTLGKSENVVIGEEVVAIGNPLGELTFSITKGIVSAVDRDIQLDNFTAVDMFQVDCAVNQGNSGGPIFNMYGEVIGIVSAKYASETIEGLGFAIPIDDVTSILPDLIEHGKVINKSYMGVQVTDITAEMISQYNMVAGAYVSIVEDGSCAQKAGLKIGDIITMLGDEKVSNVSDLLSAKRDYKAGETATLKVWRSGEYIDLSITFDEYVEPVVEEEPVVNDIPQNIIPQNPNQDFSIEDFLWEYFYNNR